MPVRISVLGRKEFELNKLSVLWADNWIFDNSVSMEMAAFFINVQIRGMPNKII